MAVFQYTAYDHDGSEKRGKIEALSENDAIASLRESGLAVMEITEKNNGDESNAFDLGALFVRVKKKDLTIFFRQLSVLIKSGVSIIHAFTILQRQCRSTGMKRLLKALTKDVEQGLDLSVAMQNTGTFSLYDIGMIKAGEESGEMDTILDTVADQMETNMAFRSQMITSMIYPVAVTIMSVAVMIILSVFIVPKFAVILGGQGKSLPMITQVLLSVTDWMQAWWLRLVGGIVAFFVFMPVIRKTETGGFIVDWVLMKIPLIGMVIKSGIVVNFARNLGILLRAGVPLSDALLTVKDTVKNRVAHNILVATYESIISGEGMAASLRNAESVFPPMVAEMVATGEETGEMEKVLELTAKIYQKTLEDFVKRMNAMIEPLLIIVMGGMVGFVVMGLMAGVMSMY